MREVLKQDWLKLKTILAGLDKKIVTVFISFAVLQTISWYITSRKFFRLNFFEALQNNPLVYFYEYIYWYAGDFIVYLVIPALIIKFYFKENLSGYGLKLGDYKSGLFYSFIFLIIMLPIIWFSSASAAFTEQYPGLEGSKDSWSLFFLFEAGTLVYIFAWEFILKGFMLFGLKDKFGYYAILIQLVPFVILHNGKPMAETFGAIAGGLALGILAFRTGSIFYCIITHYGVMFTIDLLCTLRFRTEDYGTGLLSLINIFKGFFL